MLTFSGHQEPLLRQWFSKKKKTVVLKSVVLRAERSPGNLLENADLQASP